MIATGSRRTVGVLLVLLLAVIVTLTGQVRSTDRRQVGPLGHLLLSWLTPVQLGMNHAADTVIGWWRGLNEIGQLRLENARLRAEVERLTRDVATLQEAAAENARLRRLVEFRAQTAVSTVAARVAMRDPSRWFTTMTIDRGARDGVRTRDAVVTADGLVGRVMEVYPTAARVLLISDPRSAVGVLVQSTRDAGVVEGQGRDVLRLRYVSRESSLRPGDVLITSGLGGVFPRGIRVGTVRAVLRPPGALFQEAEVVPAATVGRLEEVLVIVGRR
ncbi:MAG: rod shape-determining protein MreC [Armatimonadota bacterium]|nr:rod shape-determining protein MreC [Armatimonadota bacterium]MDR5698098.1 rod shape-determining protein MreC [Armatimonadota bacterium]